MPVVAAQSVTRQLSETFRRRDLAAARPARAPAAGPRTQEGPAWLSGAVEEVLTRRSSVRVFASSAIALSDVLGAVRAALDAEEAVWPASEHGAMGLDVLVAARNVDGLAEGLYSTRDTGPELVSLGAAHLDVVREQYADAPVLLLVCADVNQACRDAGPAGYPAALVRAGTAGYGAWLWSISAGLAGSVYGGASQHASGAGRQRDANMRHLFTVAIGAPGSLP